MRTEMLLPALLAACAGAGASTHDLYARAALEDLIARNPQWQMLLRPAIQAATNGIKNGVKNGIKNGVKSGIKNGAQQAANSQQQQQPPPPPKVRRALEVRDAEAEAEAEAYVEWGYGDEEGLFTRDADAEWGFDDEDGLFGRDAEAEAEAEGDWGYGDGLYARDADAEAEFVDDEGLFYARDADAAADPEAWADTDAEAAAEAFHALDLELDAGAPLFVRHARKTPVKDRMTPERKEHMKQVGKGIVSGRLPILSDPRLLFSTHPFPLSKRAPTFNVYSSSFSIKTVT